MQIPKNQICQGKLNFTLLVVIYPKKPTEAKNYCGLFNGHIMKRSQVGDVTSFLSEHRRVWLKSCNTMVWTDFDNGKYEYYDALSIKFSNGSYQEPKCFICTLEQRRSFFRVKLPWKPAFNSTTGGFTLRNDENGSLLFVGNDGNHIIKGVPLTVHSYDGFKWSTIAQNPERSFKPGLNEFWLSGDSGFNSKDPLMTKISNVSSY